MQVCSLVTLIGALPVKPARGRIYLPSPVTTNYTTTASYSGTHLARVSDFMAAIAALGDGAGATFVLVIYSRTFPAAGGIQQNDVASYIARGNPATQRKRRLGAGS
jgi:hypothetical protein